MLSFKGILSYFKVSSCAVVLKFLKYMEKIALLLIFLIFYSCNAPRNNPLDPYAEKGNLTGITGQVQNFSPPFIGISGVSVFWQPKNLLVKTDDGGFYKIENLTPQNGLLIFSKEGYQPDSINIEWDDSKNILANVNLNKDPVLDGAAFYSIVKMHLDSSFAYRILINVKINDPDNDIDSVYIENTRLNIIKKLEFNVSNKSYEAGLSPEEMNMNNLENAVGLDFDIIVDNIFKKKFNIGSVYLKRVINNGADIISPVNSDTVSSTPTLVWENFSAKYKFKYKVEIFTDPLGSMAPIFSEEVSSGKNSLVITDPLDKGNYYWVVKTEDEFENIFQSAIQVFHVE